MDLHLVFFFTSSKIRKRFEQLQIQEVMKKHVGNNVRRRILVCEHIYYYKIIIKITLHTYLIYYQIQTV